MNDTHGGMDVKKLWRWRRGRVLVIALILVASAMAFGVASRNAAATTVVYGEKGWAGNQVVYLTTGISSTASYQVGSQWDNASQPQFNNLLGVPNAIGLSTGGANLFEYYVQPPPGGTPYMEVVVPVVAASGSYVILGYIGYISDVFETVYHKIGLSMYNSPDSGENIQWTNNSGVNVTGTVSMGNNENQALWQLGVDAAGFLPYVGFVTGGASILMGLEKLSKVYDNSLGAGGDGEVYDEYQVINPPCCSRPTNVFISQMIVKVDLNPGDWASSPGFHLYGENIVGDQYGLTGQVPGARADIWIATEPAVTLTGRVTGAGGNAVAGAVVNIQATSGSLSGTDFQVKTNGGGYYRFFAQVNTPYNIWATQTTTFGSQTSGSAICSPEASCDDPSASSMWANLTVPTAAIQGYVSCGYSGGCPSIPTDVVENKATYVQASTTGWSFFFWIGAPGAYEVFASVGYYGSTTQPNVTVAMGHVYTVYLTLNYYPPPPGCLLAGTLISTPHGGPKRIEQLSDGDAVLGYNVTTGSWVNERVTSDTASTVDEILSINDGLLEATLTDQPLFVRNGTWVGWVLDPQNVTVGEQLFNPLTQSWVNITSLQVLQGSFKVYDLQTTAPNNFVANGVLVDRKIL